MKFSKWFGMHLTSFIKLKTYQNLSVFKQTFSRDAPKLLNSFLIFHLDKKLNNFLSFFNKNLFDLFNSNFDSLFRLLIFF